MYLRKEIKFHLFSQNEQRGPGTYDPHYSGAGLSLACIDKKEYIQQQENPMCSREPICVSHETRAKGTCREGTKGEAGLAPEVLRCCFLSTRTGMAGG